MKKSSVLHILGILILCVFAGIVWLTVFLLAVHSFDGTQEIIHTFAAVL